jgi:hypothetical protein
MSFLKAKCTSCGGSIKLDDSLKIGICEYCGSKMIVQDAIELHLEQIKSKLTIDKKSTITNLLERASQSFEDGKLDLANNFYDQIIDLDASNHFAWWGKFLIDQELPTKCIIVNEKSYSINAIKANKIEKILSETGINVSPLVNNNEALRAFSIPCWEEVYAKRAIKYADGKEKDEYLRVFNERLAVYEKIKIESNQQVMQYIGNKVREAAEKLEKEKREAAEKLEKEKREAEKRAYNDEMDNLSETTKKVGRFGCGVTALLSAVALLGVGMVTDEIVIVLLISIGFLLTSGIIKFMKKK